VGAASWPNLAGGQAVDVEQIRGIVASRGQDPQAIAHLVQLSRDLEPAVAAQLYLDVADDFFAQGALNLAADALHQLWKIYPDQPAARRGMLRLIRLYSSREVADSEQVAVLSKSWSGTEGYAAYAVHLAGMTAQAAQEFSREPEFVFERSVALRHAGNAKAAGSLLTTLKHNVHAPVWRSLALGEDWLAGERNTPPPMELVHAAASNERPHLDGVLDEPIWTGSSEDKPCQLRGAHDGEFLYLAVEVAKDAGASYLADDSPRSYDADLTAQDHVAIFLDTDRDYAAWFRLAIDHRGRTADACWRNTAWNPQWYVAAAVDAEHWCVEAAIPWSELGGEPAAGEAWGVAVKRLLPGKSATEPIPEEFKLLLFD
jgi:hypothetical protein